MIKSNLEKELGNREIILLKEGTMDDLEWMNFKLGNKTYQICLYRSGKNKDYYHITSTFHLEASCVFCEGIKEGQFCYSLHAFKYALFECLIPQSQNRLKWLTRETI